MKVTINGFDPFSNQTIKYINVWNDRKKKEILVKNKKLKYNIIGQIKHGKKVQLLDRKGDDCLIRYRKRFKTYVGYIRYWWIKEFKLELLERIEKGEVLWV